MADGDFGDSLKERREIELTVTGRRSGRESTRPIWFVRDGGRLLLLPIHGTDTSWYRNVVETPKIRLAVDGAQLEVTATTIEDAEAVAEIVERFRQKYGADQVEAYYPKKNAAIEVSLS